MTNENARTSSHFQINEPLVFEEGSPGRRAFDLPKLDIPAVPVSEIIEPGLLRDEVAGMPELGEVDVVRHFTRLSTWNYHIDLGLYPLGSCTMKYNPKVNEETAALPGFRNLHPWQPESQVQGALRMLWETERILTELTGMARVTFQPAAGAQGEMTGLLMMRAFHAAAGDRGGSIPLHPGCGRGDRQRRHHRPVVPEDGSGDGDQPRL